MRTTTVLADVAIYSWGLKGTQGLVPNPKYLINVAEWRNPQCHPDIIKGRINGTDPAIIRWIEEDERIGVASREIYRLAEMHLRGMRESYISVGVVDYHGIWTAPAVAEIIARDIEDHFKVGVQHCGITSVIAGV